jgi:sRNA-binding carbon storage regulator CsrA
MSRLVLTQKTNDKITLQKNDEDIAIISVGKIDRNQVRLTFEADPNVRIMRQPKQKKSG